MAERKHRLVDCNPRFAQMGNRGPTCWLVFDCPEAHDCMFKNGNVQIPITPSLEGEPQTSPQSNGAIWQRTGDTFETLTLSPSILMRPTTTTDGHVVDPCALHIFIKNGAIEFCGDSK